MQTGNQSARERRAAWGRLAEDEALRCYAASGARLVSRNYRRKCGEIDLVMEEPVGNEWVLVFIEVRARNQVSCWDSPEESLTAAKVRRLGNTARLFLKDYRGAASSVRFDLVALDGRETRILKNFWWY